MAGFTMPKKGEGAAALRELQDADRSPLDIDTETRIPVLTEARKEAREDTSKQGRMAVSEAVRTEANPPVSAPIRKPARTEGRPSAVGKGDFLTRVDMVLESREPLIGGVKATVDMSPELSTRAKRYLADHRGQSTRQILIALFDAFLIEKGY